MKDTDILKRMMKISPGAKDFVRGAYEDGMVDVIIDDSITTFLTAVQGRTTIHFYYSNETRPTDVKQVVRVLENSDASAETICFNVYGENKEIIALVADHGFISDMTGYILTMKKERHNKKRSILSRKDYEEKNLAGLIALFDAAYRTKHYSTNKDAYALFFRKASDAGELGLFTKAGRLVAAYLLKDAYIHDMIVDPSHQGFGFGDSVLSEAKTALFKTHDTIFLRVEADNERALRLYRRHGFEVLSRFAEHTKPLQ